MIKFARRCLAALVWLVLTPVVLMLGTIGLVIDVLCVFIVWSTGYHPHRLIDTLDFLGNCIYSLRSLVDRVGGA